MFATTRLHRNQTRTEENQSRKAAKGAKANEIYKFETRNPKFETISNAQKGAMFETG
jgi:hypothetical protein